jgi:hypothetical protein
MTSTDEMPCCTATAWGKLNEAESSPTNKGADITVGDEMNVPAYITDSPIESKKGIVIFPDM